MIGFKREAKVRYEDGNFEILEPGHFVTCAVTGTQIPLSQLRYWSVERQEAYVSPEAVLDSTKKAKK